MANPCGWCVALPTPPSPPSRGQPGAALARRGAQAILAALALGLAAPPGALSQAPGPQPLSAQARAVFDAARDKLLQIRIVERSTQAQATIGSGWLAGADGRVVTNYHVVSRFVTEPERYRVEYVRGDGSVGPLEVLAVDVVEDLAVASMGARGLPAFALAESELRKGDRGFAMGNPHDLGLTIVEGTHNGLVENTLAERFHFTGAINEGMSGGPAVTPEGRVYGVNVAKMRDNNLVSFLVPARFVAALLARAPVAPPPAEALRTSVARQVLERQERVLADIFLKPVPASPMGRYSVPDSLGSFMRCWGDTTTERSKPYVSTYKVCDAQASLFLSDELDTGGLAFGHVLLSAPKLDALRFSSLLEQTWSNVPSASGTGTSEDLTPMRCRERFVQSASGTLRAALCLRAYRRLEGIYDLRLKLVTLEPRREALVSWLSADGLSMKNALELARRYMDAVRWKP